MDEQVEKLFPDPDPFVGLFVKDIEPYEKPDDAVDVAVTAINPPAALIRIGGREYPWRTEPKCHVCTSPNREFIENEVYAGRPYTQIVRQLPKRTAVSRHSITSHVQGDHMPLAVSVRAALVAERAIQQKKKIEDTESSVIDHVLLCRAIVADAFQGMAEKGRRATMAEGLAAARVLALMGVDESAQGIDRETMIGTFVSYMTAAARVMDPAQMEAFAALLRSDPRLRELQKQFENQNAIEAAVEQDAEEMERALT